jgi:hypothetical protein
VKFLKALIGDMNPYLASGHKEHEAYYRRIANELRQRGVHVPFRTALRAAYRAARRAIGKLPFARKIWERLRNTSGRRESGALEGKYTIIRGSDQEPGFHNIYEAAKVYSQLIRTVCHREPVARRFRV